MSVALVTVVSGEIYERYAKDMFASAFEFFGPDPVVAHIALPGREGWPDATLYRYDILHDHSYLLHGFTYTFLIDADMRFEAPVGREIRGGLVATLHPGYVGKPEDQLPFERGSKSTARCSNPMYFCGGFVGGETTRVLELAGSIRAGIHEDSRRGVMAQWHDESHLQRALAYRWPSLILSPSYCYPDNDSAYVSWWPERYERKIVAIDKTPAERGNR